MEPLAAVLLLAMIVIVIAVVTAPLNAARVQRRAHSAEIAELESERDAKYQEIRDAQLDFQLRKHSAEDFAAVEATLKGEALAILDRIETLEALEASSAHALREDHAVQPPDDHTGAR